MTHKKTTKKSGKKAVKKTPQKKENSKKKKSAKTKKQRSFLGWAFRFCFKWGLVAALWLAIIIGGIVLWYAQELPSITKSMVFERRPTVIIKADNGDIIDRHGDIKGDVIDVKMLPSHITNAVLATEDRRFYSHFGLDLKGFLRALSVNVKQGGFVQGGSTITQQLAKNLFLSRDRTIKRKIQELILSFQLERELSKDEILSAYLNRVYMGSGAYGIDGAARIYFNKSAYELDIREAATIAGLLKAPSRYSPSVNPELSAQRTKVVMQSMANAGYITNDEVQSYKNIPPSPRRKPSSASSIRYFTDYVVSQVDDLVGNVDEDITIETTLNQTIQKEMEETLTKSMLRYGPSHQVGQAAGLFMRLDGAVVGMMGGKNYQHSEFNRTTEAIRQPGSSFKPFVYLAALENGYDLYSFIMDEKIESGRYKPKNFGNQYYGLVTLEEALTQSLNTVAVNLTREIGISAVIETARRLGITANLEPNLSTSLGSSGVPMIQMVTAYTTLARGGSAADPYAIKRIISKSGEILYDREPPRRIRPVVDAQNIAQINAMMRSVINNGTGKAANLPYPAAGKTGTTQDYRDAWFIGFTNRYAGAIWFGNDDNSPTKKLTGGSAPALAWKQVMLTAQKQGGKAYNSFANVNIVPPNNEFNGLLDGILNDPTLLNPTLGNTPSNATNNDGRWFSNIFGGGGNTQQPAPSSQQEQPRTVPERQEQAPAPTPNRIQLEKIPGHVVPQAPQQVPQPEEYTPMGRHQWEMNE